MSNNFKKPLKPPSNLDLPFFAYGIFKPNQLAYSNIENYVKREFPSEIKYKMLMRDGVPLIVSNDRYKSTGYLIYFKEDCKREAYEIISNSQVDRLYKWEVIQVGENKANVLMGVNPDLGSSPMYENKGNYDGRIDPFFTEALDVVEKELNDENNHWADVEDFFKLQMAYMLLWSAIDRYCTLKYEGQSFGDYHRKWQMKKFLKNH